MVAADIRDGEGKLVTVDRFQFMFARSSRQSYPILNTSESAHDLTRDRGQIQLRTYPELQLLVVNA